MYVVKNHLESHQACRIHNVFSLQCLICGTTNFTHGEVDLACLGSTKVQILRMAGFSKSVVGGRIKKFAFYVTCMMRTPSVSSHNVDTAKLAIWKTSLLGWRHMFPRELTGRPMHPLMIGGLKWGPYKVHR
jgi:hypothetical protein